MKLIFLVFLCIFSGKNTAAYGPISDHFIQYLKNDNKWWTTYLKDHISKYDETGSFGGKLSSLEQAKNDPIVFIHGNSDSALKFGTNDFQSGWDSVISYFLENGYEMAELYGISYGDRNITNSYLRSLTCENILLLRHFIVAVAYYTGIPKVNIIAHSMGVTIARKAIRGGKIFLSTESCDVGTDLSPWIKNFIAISSANYGMCACENVNAPACGMEIGFGPGTCSRIDCLSPKIDENHPCFYTNYSKILENLNNENPKKEAEFVASLWSKDDEVLLKDNLVWGKKTSLVPFSDFSKEYPNLNHVQTKTETAEDQFQLITKRSVQF